MTAFDEVDIRLATEDDIPVLFDILSLMHREIALAPVNVEKAGAFIYEGVIQDEVFVAISDQAIVGVIGIIEDEWWFSDSTILTDRFFYVLPDYRKGPVGPALIEAAKMYAEIHGLPIIIKTVNPKRSKAGAARMRLFSQAGFFPVGDGLILNGASDGTMRVEQDEIEDDAAEQSDGTGE